MKEIHIKRNKMVCEVCGKPYILITYPRPGPAPGFRYVPDCACVTEFDKRMEKEKKKLMDIMKRQLGETINVRCNQ